MTLKEQLEQILAAYRHETLGVTFGRKRVAVTAVDMIIADQLLALFSKDGAE